MMASPADLQRLSQLLAALGVYRPARQAFLQVLDLPASNRDPFAEFSEHLAHALLGGTLAASRVQARYDLTLDDGRTAQVRYLANPGPAWVNEHRVYRIADVDLYALVILEAFTVKGMLVVPLANLLELCAALGKRHTDQENQLLLTQANWRRIRTHPNDFSQYGASIWTPPPSTEAFD